MDESLDLRRQRTVCRITDFGSQLQSDLGKTDLIDAHLLFLHIIYAFRKPRMKIFHVVITRGCRLRRSELTRIVGWDGGWGFPSKRVDVSRKLLLIEDVRDLPRLFQTAS